MQFLQEIYKFSVLRAEFLSTRYVRLTPRLELNDPYDSHPFQDDIPDLRKAHKRLHGGPVPDDADLLNQHFAGVGVASFTESIYNILMWSHYADSHKGMAVCFDAKHKFFDGLRRVRYMRQRTNLRKEYPKTKGVELFFKAEEWIYEKEWRIVRPLSSCDCIYDASTKKASRSSTLSLPLTAPKFAMLIVPKEAIKSVILGVWCPESDVKAIKRALTRDPGYKHVTLQKVKIHADKYELDLVSL